MNTSSAANYEFGDFRLEVSRRRLLRRGEAVALTPKLFDTLLHLVQNHDRVCEKEELMQALWPDTAVEENNLNQTISALRRSLTQGAGEDRYIITVPGRGYRFSAAVRSTPKDAATIKAIAVLPFKPLVLEDRDEALELGMADTLIARLSQTRGTVVRPLTSVRKFTSLDQDAAAAGRELGVHSVLDGSIQRRGNLIRVTARLTNVADESSLWSQTFDEEFTDVFAVQDAISEKVAAALAMRLSTEEKKGLTKRYTENVEAYHLYLKGLYHLGKVTPPAIRKGIEFFQQAVEMDPVYALAYAGIAEAYRRLPITSDVPPKEAFPRAKSAALKALEIDDTLAEAHMSLGWVRFWYEWDWQEGEKELLRAIELSPSNGVAQMSHLVLLATQGRMDEAIQAGYRSVEFEPLSQIVNANLAWCLHCGHRDQEAVARLEKTLEIDPNFWVAHLNLGKIYTRQREYARAIAAFEKAKQFSGGNSETISMIGHASALAGNLTKAVESLNELKLLSSQRYIPPHNIAVIYAALGDKQQTCAWLEKAYEDRDVRLTLINVESKWDLFRAEPCFQSILKRVGLTS